MWRAVHDQASAWRRYRCGLWSATGFRPGTAGQLGSGVKALGRLTPNERQIAPGTCAVAAEAGELWIAAGTTTESTHVLHSAALKLQMNRSSEL